MKAKKPVYKIRHFVNGKEVSKQEVIDYLNGKDIKKEKGA